jgi:hypothetical protein
MRRTLPIVALVLLTFCFISQAWCSDDQPFEQMARRWAAALSEQPSSASPSTSQSSLPIFQTSVTPTFTLLPALSPRLRDRSPETDGPRTKGFLAKTTWLKGIFVTETEIANSSGGAGWLQSSIPGDTRSDASTRMVRLGLSGTQGSFRYGLTYRTAGQSFLNAPDQAGREIWGEWKAGYATMRSAIGQLWNNVEGEATRPRLIQTYGRMGITFAKPLWPELTVSYSRNSLNSALEPLGITPQRIQSHTLEGAVAYQKLRWNVRLASSYSFNNDLLRGAAESNVRMQLFSATFRPLNTVTLAPMVAYREEVQEWSGVRIDGLSASLALHYKQSRRLLITAMGNYVNSHSNDRLVDNENLGGKGIFAWDLPQSPNWNALIAIEAGYNRLTNRVTPSADTEDVSGLVRVVVAAL